MSKKQPTPQDKSQVMSLLKKASIAGEWPQAAIRFVP